MPKEITQIITNCEECPNAEVSRVYTADSFENCRKIYCKKLNKDIHKCLDWNEDSKIPNDCPLEGE